jgi:hypothetical protein
VFDVHLSDGHVLQNYRSIVRDFVPGSKGEDQAVHLYGWRDGNCTDTLLPITAVSSISTGGLGSMGSPLSLSIYPAREFSHVSSGAIPANVIEITALAGYAGTDTSSRNIGFKSFYEGVEVLAAPFGTMLGEKWALAIGGEFLFEGGRMRIPAMGELRYTFLGNETMVDAVHYTDSCAIGCFGSAPLPLPDSSFHQVSTSTRSDSSSFLLRDRTVARSSFRPFIYAEGSYIFNGSFTGAGQNPSINPEDYGQYFFGAGVGTPFLSHFTVSLGYRYMRLNLRTPCPTCVDQFILNTNVSNSIILKIGIRLS